MLQIQYPELGVGDLYKAKILSDTPSDSSGRLTCYSKIRLLQSCCTAVVEEIDLVDSDDHDAMILEPVYSLSVCKETDSLTRFRQRSLELLCQGLFLTQSFDECVKMIDTSDEGTGYLNRLRLLAFRAMEYEVHYHQRMVWESRSFGTGALIIYDQKASRPRSSAPLQSREDLIEEQQILAAGSTLCEPYPWMPSDFLRRPTELRNSINIPLDLCQVASSHVRDDISFTEVNATRANDVLGMFATVNLSSETQFLIDTSVICATDQSSRCFCCQRTLPSTIVTRKYQFLGSTIMYCSNECKDLANSTYHEQISREWKRAIPGASTSIRSRADQRLLLRVLATALEGGNIHALHTSLIGRMTAQYSQGSPQLFTLHDNILTPMRMLEGMGVDVFARHDLDTWVLLTIQARIRTNIREQDDEDGYLVAINPVYIFFNHSCEPNVDISPDPDRSKRNTLIFTTNKRVRKDGELLISYLNEADLELPYKERREKLLGWTGAGCRCTRCLREEEADEMEI